MVTVHDLLWTCASRPWFSRQQCGAQAESQCMRAISSQRLSGWSLVKIRKTLFSSMIISFELRNIVSLSRGSSRVRSPGGAIEGMHLPSASAHIPIAGDAAQCRRMFYLRHLRAFLVGYAPSTVCDPDTSASWTGRCTIMVSGRS